MEVCAIGDAIKRKLAETGLGKTAVSINHSRVDRLSRRLNRCIHLISKSLYAWDKLHRLRCLNDQDFAVGSSKAQGPQNSREICFGRLQDSGKSLSDTGSGISL